MTEPTVPVPVSVVEGAIAMLREGTPEQRSMMADGLGRVLALLSQQTAAPTSIIDMAPGTELTVDYYRVTRRVRVLETGSVWLRGIDGESPSVRVDDLDSSTIRDVTPPK